MITRDTISEHLHDIFGQDMHAKRILSLAYATQGVIESSSLAIHAIGNGSGQNHEKPLFGAVFRNLALGIKRKQKWASRNNAYLSQVLAGLGI
ncbi:hypothetical protein UN63_12195 [Oceanisphaera arctica]|uniref:Uncharacterized protein n=1 Tax=Oceanisphaera arctica TaxID=641510 RepID=A0A2P5TK76_9GAMM|nr:hypothetical protein UN63_12195 [Oceanisphaera arctica]GHA27597.1 hypothetical protein GCM10007082_29750 [Oceanisphaera arctica]